MPPSSQKFIARSRAPRVAIDYDIELYGAQRRMQLPFVIGVLADLSGHISEPLQPLAERKFTEFDVDNFDARMAVIRPQVVLQVPDVQNAAGELVVEIVFECLADFDPGTLAGRIPALRVLLERRQHLANLMGYLDGKSAAEDLLRQVLRDPALLRALADGTGSAGTGTGTGTVSALADGTPLADKLQQVFRPRSADAAQALERALRHLAQEAIARGGVRQTDAVVAIEQLLAGLDALLSAQLRPVLHHPQFQLLESAWRGLHYLVSNVETSESLKIRVLNISQAELAKTLRRHKGATWDQSPLFKRIYEDEFGSFGGEPYGCIVGDYTFDHSAPDIETLGELAKICAAAHAPFITGAALSFANAMPAPEGIESRRTVVGHPVTSEYAAWRSLQHSEESRYIALALPRFLARQPWGSATRPVEEFAFEEIVAAGAPQQHVWCNAAHAMAVGIARAHALYGWYARIRGVESGGAVEGLPVYRAVTAAGERCAVGPVEVAINDREEAELARAGFLTLVHHRNADFAAFLSAPSIYKHGTYDDPAADTTARLAATLPYLLICCRFVQYLKCKVRDQIGSMHDRAAMEHWLQQWIGDYVIADAAQSSEELKARRPLASAELHIVEIEGNPGHYTARLYLRPAYQLDELPSSMRIVSRLPSGKSAL